MMNSYLRRKPVPTRDINLEEPPNRRWRFYLTHWVPTSALMIFAFIILPATSAMAEGWRYVNGDMIH